MGQAHSDRKAAARLRAYAHAGKVDSLNAYVASVRAACEARLARERAQAERKAHPGSDAVEGVVSAFPSIVNGCDAVSWCRFPAPLSRVCATPVQLRLVRLIADLSGRSRYRATHCSEQGGATPLFVAAQRGHARVVSALLGIPEVNVDAANQVRTPTADMLDAALTEPLHYDWFAAGSKGGRR